MKIIQKSILNLKAAEYCIYHLNIINTFLPVELTPKEREILGTFMAFSGEAAELDRFGTTFRKQVKQMLKISDAGLSNHILSLKNKGAIKEVDGTLVILDLLIPEPAQQGYQFKIVKENGQN